MTHLGLDLDGTLFDTPGVSYDDPESVRVGTQPIQAACDWVRHFILTVPEARVSYHTGRTEPVRAITEFQIKQWLPAGPLYMSRKWEGYDRMAVTKAVSLQVAGCHVYIGDHAADETAARLAGIPFIHARDMQRGDCEPWRTGSVDRMNSGILMDWPKVDRVQQRHNARWATVATPRRDYVRGLIAASPGITSGEIQRMLGCSQTAVWKHLTALENLSKIRGVNTPLTRGRTRRWYIQ